MPDLDSGHYFFTALVPVWNDGIVQHRSVGAAKPMKSSPIHMVREALETLPTALQSHATEAIGINSPFARSRPGRPSRTHFARFAIIDQPNYNGRDPTSPIREVLPGAPNLLEAQPRDVLTCPYIVVSIDFDPSTPDAKDEPRSYLEELWTLMPQELTAVFQYCYGFHADPARGYPGVTDAKSFADFLIPCQLETTMSFNDYYTGPPPLKSMSLTPIFLLAAAAVLGPLVANYVWRWTSWGLAIVAAVALLILVVLLGLRYVLWVGGRAFPGNPDATLPHVLKGLYLQQALIPFAAAQQGRTLDERGTAFRAFLKTHRPADLAGPTQPPGVIRSTIAQVTP